MQIQGREFGFLQPVETNLKVVGEIWEETNPGISASLCHGNASMWRRISNLEIFALHQLSFSNVYCIIFQRSLHYLAQAGVYWVLYEQRA